MFNRRILPVFAVATSLLVAGCQNPDGSTDWGSTLALGAGAGSPSSLYLFTSVFHSRLLSCHCTTSLALCSLTHSVAPPHVRPLHLLPRRSRLRRLCRAELPDPQRGQADDVGHRARETAGGRAQEDGRCCTHSVSAPTLALVRYASPLISRTLLPPMTDSRCAVLHSIDSTLAAVTSPPFAL